MKLDRLERWATVRHFRLAIALVEYGSILHAARSMHLSQPTASKLLQDLEEAVGARLFMRSRRGVTPTELGRAFVERSHGVLAQIDHVSHAIDALGRGYSGRVTVGCVLTGSSYLVPAAIARLRSSRPDIRIKIVDGVSAELIPRLIAGELDFLIGRLSDVGSSPVVAQEALFSENAIIVGRHDHPLAQQPDATLETLAGAAWMLPHAETTLRKQFDNLFYRQSIDPPHATIETVSLFNILWLLRQTDLLGILPQSVAFDPVYSAEIVRLPAFEPLLLGQIGISRLPGVTLSPAAQALVQTLREVIDDTSQALAG
ncbi:LysR family transcriptional regulator [Pseudomonas sp. GZD-222]|uniref:LysR family transcriptional regulator n=1 Tax=Pseudomonas sp. GZD-222 TaxID=3404805 RepID=UPI003BB70A2F